MPDYATSGYFVLNQRDWYELNNLYRQIFLRSRQRHDCESTTVDTEYT